MGVLLSAWLVLARVDPCGHGARPRRSAQQRSDLPSLLQEVNRVAKRLYVVQVEFEFAALAESAQEACRFTDDAIRDMSMMDDCAHARIIGFHKFPGSDQKLPMKPDGWDDDALVYGAGNLTLAEAIEEERKIQDAEKQGG